MRVGASSSQANGSPASEEAQSSAEQLAS